ncbi:MAG: class I SAM-dependent methyltransferase [Candidatus Aureabacteria bacterium]|nr:class I SAM-dependent methyltransferase [Candidatus Auribacterota bacterium]
MHQKSCDSAWLRTLATGDLIDLGQLNHNLEGILSPRYDEEHIKRYLTNQFLDEASVYAEKYQNEALWGGYLSRAFERLGMGIDQRRELTILDIGSGAGNTIFPLLSLCPASRIIASDLSVNLLHMLKKTLAERKLLDCCLLMQLDAEKLIFRDGAFDLVVGGAILHHLFLPENAIAGCARILKKGGCAIFFEPFENGNAILALAYREILSRARSVGISRVTKKLLRALIKDFDIRRGRDKSLPIFSAIDDKWLFTKNYFHELAEQCQFSRCTIFPLHQAPEQFEGQTGVYLRLGAGQSRDALPAWAWKIIRRYDAGFSDDMKGDLLIEGAVIFQK